MIGINFFSGLAPSLVRNLLPEVARSALGKVMVPYLRAEMFFSRLRLVSPATMAHLGEHEVICRTVVAGQCHHLTACCF